MGTFFAILGLRSLQGKSCWSEKYKGDFSVWGLDFVFKVRVKIMQIKDCACSWSPEDGVVEQWQRHFPRQLRAVLLNNSN